MNDNPLDLLATIADERQRIFALGVALTGVVERIGRELAWSDDETERALEEVALAIVAQHTRHRRRVRTEGN